MWPKLKTCSKDFTKESLFLKCHRALPVSCHKYKKPMAPQIWLVNLIFLHRQFFTDNGLAKHIIKNPNYRGLYIEFIILSTLCVAFPNWATYYMSFTKITSRMVIIFTAVAKYARWHTSAYYDNTRGHHMHFNCTTYAIIVMVVTWRYIRIFGSALQLCKHKHAWFY